jgi:hypothetical protein
MWPPAKIITISADPIARGGITPPPPAITVQPIVNTKKNAPMNSAMYLFMLRDSFSTTSETCEWQPLGTTARHFDWLGDYVVSLGAGQG